MERGKFSAAERDSPPFSLAALVGDIDIYRWRASPPPLRVTPPTYVGSGRGKNFVTRSPPLCTEERVLGSRKKASPIRGREGWAVG